LLLSPLAVAASPRPQIATTIEGSVTVTGVGEATAPAEMADAQILLGRASDGRGFIGDSDESEIETADRLDPIVAEAEAAGVGRDELTLVFNPVPPSPFSFPAAIARLDFTVSQPTTAAMSRLFRSVHRAAASADLEIVSLGVRYGVEDCEALEAAAEEDALLAAREQAERLAGLADVSINEVVALSTGGDLFGLGLSNCDEVEGQFFTYPGEGLGVSLPPFDPAMEAEVSVYAALTVSYAISEEAAN
jgi:hypothetical protein